MWFFVSSVPCLLFGLEYAKSEQRRSQFFHLPCGKLVGEYKKRESGKTAFVRMLSFSSE